MTFRERFLCGDCRLGAVDDWVEIWHNGIPNGQTLQDFLGLSAAEYQTWLKEGHSGLAKILSKGSQVHYTTVYLNWGELNDQLQSLVQKKLSQECVISIGRLDYYHWEMKFKFQREIDEALSASVCERLGLLQSIEPNHFVNCDVVDDDQLLHLLEELTGHEVSSSHADNGGVWIICKDHQTSSEEFAARLLSDFEKRLNSEIHGRSRPSIDQKMARQQLIGFKEALMMLGILPKEQEMAASEHVPGIVPAKDWYSAGVGVPCPEAIQKALMCLANNGIEADETENVLEALGYILLDAEIIQQYGISTIPKINKGIYTSEDGTDSSKRSCKEQQQFIDEVAASIGCVVIRPDARADYSGPNTVHLYLPDDIRQGSAGEQGPVRRGRKRAASPKCGKKETDLYQESIWSFKNTDQFGRIDCQFANSGQLDLRGHNWKTILEGSIKLAYYERVQSLYALGWGGYAELKEADDTYNDLNRRIIDAFYKVNGTAFLGEINLSHEKRQQIVDGTDRLFEEYTGQLIYNFGCQFVVPVADKTLEQLILGWNGISQSSHQPSVDEIMAAIKRLDGRSIHWC